MHHAVRVGRTISLIHAVDTTGVFYFFQIFYSRICVRLSEQLPGLLFTVSSFLLIGVPYIQYPDANPHSPKFQNWGRRKKKHKPYGVPSRAVVPPKRKNKTSNPTRKYPYIINVDTPSLTRASFCHQVFVSRDDKL